MQLTEIPAYAGMTNLMNKIKPTFVGMTKEKAGMTNLMNEIEPAFAGMTKEKTGMTIIE